MVLNVGTIVIHSDLYIFGFSAREAKLNCDKSCQVGSPVMKKTSKLSKANFCSLHNLVRDVRLVRQLRHRTSLFVIVVVLLIASRNEKNHETLSFLSLVTNQTDLLWCCELRPCTRSDLNEMSWWKALHRGPTTSHKNIGPAQNATCPVVDLFISLSSQCKSRGQSCTREQQTTHCIKFSPVFSSKV